MNSTQLHYREATKLLQEARTSFSSDVAEQCVAEAQVHATLGLIAAISELTRQADPDATECTVEAVAAATGVLTPNNVIHHAFNAFGSNT